MVSILGANSVSGGYEVSNSLRFNDDDSAYLSRTPSSSGNQQIWTLSTWIKKSKTGDVFQNLFSQTGGAAASQRAYVLFSDDVLVVAQFNGSSLDFNYTSNAKFRDVSAWYHLVVSVDTTQGTESNRIKIYINGEQITSFSSTTNPSQNLNTYVNTTQVIGIGHDTKVSSRFFDGYVTETHLIDGTAKAPTDFGEFDEDSGIWKPKRYTGTYGTNGFFLQFKQTGTSQNSSGIGADTSGNDNHFAVTNLAATDVTEDTCQNNFATFNSLIKESGTLSEGNLKSTGDGSVPSDNSISTMGVNTGKWYAEFQLTADGEISSTTQAGFGICDEQSVFFDVGNNFQTTTANAIGMRDDGNMYNYGTQNSSWGTSFTTNDILQIALDMDNGYVYFGKNGTWMNSGVPTSGSSGTGGVSITNTDRNYFMFVGESYYFATPVWSANFGNPSFSISSGNSDDNGYGNFEYAPPSGYLALCTQNLATELSPTIDDGSQYFNTLLWTGNGSTRSITGLGFSPDWVWIKDRGAGSSHVLYDTIRGVQKQVSSDNTSAELTREGVTAFGSDGFSLGTYANVNESNLNFVGWSWRGSDSNAVSNTDGAVTSTVSANTTAGFSIVTHTGTGSGSTTVGHGLGKVPAMIIVKDRDQARSWNVYHQSLGNNKGINLSNSGAASGADAGWWNNTSPTSSVFTLGTYENESAKYVSYCFAPITGYSAMGKWTGTGIQPSPFVYTGFKPSWIIYKRTDASSIWVMIDAKRSPINPTDKYLRADTSNAESDYDILNFMSNGFEIDISSPDASTNTAGADVIYMAFAENPFVTSGAVPVTAK